MGRIYQISTLKNQPSSHLVCKQNLRFYFGTKYITTQVKRGLLINARSDWLHYVGTDTRNHTLTRPENRLVCLFVIGIIQKINIHNISKRFIMFRLFLKWLLQNLQQHLSKTNKPNKEKKGDKKARNRQALIRDSYCFQFLQLIIT